MRNGDARIKGRLWATFRTSTMGDAKIHAEAAECIALARDASHNRETWSATSCAGCRSIPRPQNGRASTRATGTTSVGRAVKPSSTLILRGTWDPPNLEPSHREPPNREPSNPEPANREPPNH